MKTVAQNLLGIMLLGMVAGCTVHHMQEIKKDDDSIYLRTSEQTIYIQVGPFLFDGYDEHIHECEEVEEDDGTPVLECQTVDVYVNGRAYDTSSD